MSSFYNGLSKIASFATVPILTSSAALDQQREQQQQAEATLATLQVENRRLAETVAKLTLEKSMLKDLVEKAYHPDGNAGQPLDAESMLQWQHEKHELHEKLGELEQSLAQARKTSAAEAKRVAVFEAELNRAQQELRENDVQAAKFRTFNAAHEALLHKYKYEVQAREAAEATVASLMETVSEVDSARNEMERAHRAALAKCAEDTLELERRLDNTTAALVEAREELARERDNTTTLRQRQKLSSSSVDVTAPLSGSMASNPTSMEDSSRVEVLEDEVLRLDKHIRQLEAAFEAQRAQLIGAEQECDELRGLLATNEGLHAAAATSGSGADKEKWDRLVTQLRAEHEEATRAMVERQLRTAHLHFCSERAQWSLERKALEDTVAALSAKSPKGHHSTTPTSSGGGVTAACDSDETLQKENEALIQRLAQLQEQVWSLETTKRSYEDEIVRLNQCLRDKSDLLRDYFDQDCVPTQAAPAPNSAPGMSGYLLAAASRALGRAVGSSHDDVADETATGEAQSRSGIDALHEKMEALLMDNWKLRRLLDAKRHSSGSIAPPSEQATTYADPPRLAPGRELP